MEIDARGGTFQACEAFGQQLLQNNHYASDDVHGKLEELADARQNLEKSVVFDCLLVIYLKAILLRLFPNNYSRRWTV